MPSLRNPAPSRNDNDDEYDDDNNKNDKKSNDNISKGNRTGYMDGVNDGIRSNEDGCDCEGHYGGLSNYVRAPRCARGSRL